ncbi:MAG: WbqC family protein [Candidatus Hydrogenedentes bacterium]|nr:WbqC family protein [Candidatus Hydrogenedentota bacterium]
MLCGIHQLHYLPWLRYFDKIARADVFIVLDNIQYNKNGWQNRNKIKGATGALLLTVPVHAPLGSTLDEVAIDNTQPWRKKHWAAIQQNYQRAPYFSDHEAFLCEVYSREWRALNELNRHMLEYYVAVLGIHTRIAYSSELDVPGIATERLINLIHAVGADMYYSGAYALDQYLDASQLESSGIALHLQEWRAPVYPQFHGSFVPDLSIVDLLMHCGPVSLDVIMGKVAV